MQRAQNVYRRPSTIEGHSSYEPNVHNTERPHSPRMVAISSDHGRENFSYDPIQLKQWLAPATLTSKEAVFPQLMKIELDTWSHGGAAVSTALARIDDLSKEAITRGWPQHRGFGHFSRQGSAGSPTTAGASEGSMPSSGAASPFVLPVSANPNISSPSNAVLTPPSTADSTAAGKAGSPVQQMMGAIDSPLISPAGANTPARGFQDVKRDLPDLSKLPSELSPHLSTFTPPGSQNAGLAFDESSWDTYMNSFQAELSDIRHRAMSRWRGFTRSVEKLHHEYHKVAEFENSMRVFEAWWNVILVEMSQCEQRVEALHPPELEKVKKQRLDLGLPL